VLENYMLDYEARAREATRDGTMVALKQMLKDGSSAGAEGSQR